MTYAHPPLWQLKKLYADGYSTRRIAQMLGASENTVYVRLVRAGVTMRRGWASGVCLCGKPAVKPGRMCAEHLRERLAAASRKYYRAKFNVQPERFRRAA